MKSALPEPDTITSRVIMTNLFPASPRRPQAIISRQQGLLLTLLMVLVRSTAGLAWGDQYFDADQAVMGLMAKHIAEGRALPVFQYGAAYVLVLEAWLMAPLVAIAENSILLVRAVPAALNAVTAGLLYWMLSGSGLRPAMATLAAAPLALAGPAAAHELTAALGMSIEPLLFALVIWLVRERPLALGVVIALAIKTREFAVYALAALLFVDLLRDRTATLWRPRQVGLVAFAITWSAVGVLSHFATPAGPGTDNRLFEGNNVSVAASAICIAPETMPSDITMVATELLPFQYGVRSAQWRVTGHPGAAPPDASWLWLPLVMVLGAGAVRGLSRAWHARPTAITWLALYLLLIGVQAIAVYATSRCGNASFFTVRYLLLSMLIPPAAIALTADGEPRRWMRGLVTGTTLVWLGVLALGHLTVVRGYLASPPTSGYRQVAAYLEQQGARYLIADYWIGYHIAFLSGERIKPLTDFERIHDYPLAVNANRDEAWIVRRPDQGRCDGALPVGGLFVCAPPP